MQLARPSAASLEISGKNIALQADLSSAALANLLYDALVTAKDSLTMGASTRDALIAAARSLALDAYLSDEIK